MATGIRMADHVAWQCVDAETVVVDLDRKRALGLNPVASLVWSMIESHSLTEINTTIDERFRDADPQCVRRDVDAFVHDMVNRGLLVRC